MDEYNYFCKLNIQPTAIQITSLYAWQESYNYQQFWFTDENTGEEVWDGNYLARNIEDIPLHIKELYPLALSLSGSCMLLKNTGNVPRHDDIYRQASITIPLNYTKSYTTFWDEEEEYHLKLYHHGEAYLQNNKAVHEVVDNRAEFRHFFQINFFDHDYFYYRDLFKEYGYV
jgi:hypothetical protein